MSRAYVDLAKYPFLVDLEKFMEERFGTRNWKLILDTSTPYTKIALERLKLIIEQGENSIAKMPLLSTDEEILSFYIMLILLGCIQDKRVIERVLTILTKRFSQFLRDESPKSLEAIATGIGIDLKYLGVCGKEIVIAKTLDGTDIKLCFDFAVNIFDYLRITSKRLSQSTSWKLTNQIVLNGKVYLNRDKAARLLEEAIYLKLKESVKPFEPPPELAAVVEELKNIVSKYYSSSQTITIRKSQLVLPSKIVVEAFPPCIRNIYDQLLAGANLSHQQRFALATFLINIGMDLDEILDLFRNAPDFNEKIARYQIEHLAGLRGSKKRYLPYSCDTMRSLGLCIWDCKVKNPLVAYLRNVKKLSAGEGGISEENKAQARSN